jgi:shikimate kinase
MSNQKVIIIMGVSGSGKTVIGSRLAARLKLPFYDADDFHSLIDGLKASMETDPIYRGAGC